MGIGFYSFNRNIGDNSSGMPWQGTSLGKISGGLPQTLSKSVGEKIEISQSERFREGVWRTEVIYPDRGDSNLNHFSLPTFLAAKPHC